MTLMLTSKPLFTYDLQSPLFTFWFVYFLMCLHMIYFLCLPFDVFTYDLHLSSFTLLCSFTVDQTVHGDISYFCTCPLAILWKLFFFLPVPLSAPGNQVSNNRTTFLIPNWQLLWCKHSRF